MEQEDLKLDYLNSVIKLKRNRIVGKNNKIDTQLILGGVHQVLTSKFGFDRNDFLIAIRWLKQQKKSKKLTLHRK